MLTPFYILNYTVKISNHVFLSLTLSLFFFLFRTLQYVFQRQFFKLIFCRLSEMFGYSLVICHTFPSCLKLWSVISISFLLNCNYFLRFQTNGSNSNEYIIMITWWIIVLLSKILHLYVCIILGMEMKTISMIKVMACSYLNEK